MERISRRELLSRSGKVALGAVALTVPEVLYRAPWTHLAAAQTPPTVLATFTALVEAVTTAADEVTAQWIITEFDKALPPLPTGSVTAAVAAVLDARTVAGGHAPTYATATPDQRREVLGDMVKDPDPDMRQIANQLLPFCSFAYWSDITLAEPAQPDGERPPQWDEVSFPGPSHGYDDTYTDGGPSGFAAMTDFEA